MSRARIETWWQTFLAGTFWGAWSALVAFALLMPREMLQILDLLVR